MSIFLGARLYKRRLDLETAERQLLGMVPTGALVLFFLIFHKIATSVAAPYNWTRLQRTFLLAHGEPLYYSPEGPVVLAMYGPVSAFIYWPATWMRSLYSMMITASSINLFIFWLPALWLCLGFPHKDKRARLYGLAALFIFSFFPFITASLRSAAFNVHADAPALGFAGLACAALLLQKDKPSPVVLALSALSTVAAFWSKQVTAPLFLAIASYLWLRGLRRGSGVYAAFFIFFMAVVSGLFFKAFGFENLWFNLITIPSQQPWKSADGSGALWFSVYKLFHNSFFVFLFAAIVFISVGRLNKDKPWFLFLWTAFFMLPAAIIGNLKVGGAGNVFCYVPYFLLLAAILALAELNLAGRLRQFTNFLLLGFLVTQTVLVVYKFTVPPPETNYAQTAYEYLKKHPGTAYFPRLTLVHLLTEGKVYHESVALIDRRWAKIPVSPSQMRAFIPAHAALLAFHESVGDDRHWLDLPEYAVKVRDPELPGFVVYKKAET